MQQIIIQNPCNENWDNMIPNNNGKHCNQCSKTVIDFTAWHQNDILTFLNKNANNKICGRFTQTQLEEKIPTPEQFVKQISYFRIDNIKKVAAIFLFVFTIVGTSCNEHTTGEIVTKASIDTTIQNKIEQQTLLGDTIITPIKDTMVNTHTKGEVSVINTKHKKIEVCNTPIMGDVRVQDIPKVVPDVEIPAEPILMGKPEMVNNNQNDTLKVKE